MCLNNRKKSFFAVLMILPGLSLFSEFSQAQEDGSIYIDSNSAVYDDNKGISTYTGNVKAKQGNLIMNSDELVVYFKKGKVEKLVATGTPVDFTHRPEAGKEPIKGHSLRAEYYPETSLLLMMKEAIVIQGKNTYESEIIKYNNKDAIVRAGEQSTDESRVHVIIKQKQKTEDNGETGSEASSEKIQ